MKTRSNIGHRPNLSTLRAELHYLLATFLASNEIARTAAEEFEAHRLFFDFREMEADAITKLLLSIAVTLRVLDDREDGTLEMMSLYCGLLVKDLSDPPGTTQGLSLREACNKIIHAKTVEFDRDETPGAHPHLKAFVYLAGQDQRRRQWTANVNVVHFVRECMSGLSLIQQDQ